VQKPISNFQLAYAAHVGDLDKETLHGAAKHLYETLTKEQLKVYVDNIEKKTIKGGKRIKTFENVEKKVRLT
jgi:hypothetical protein